MAAFCRAVFWPLSSLKLLSVPRPAAPDTLDEIVDINQSGGLLGKKQAVLRKNVFGEEALLHSSRYVDTTWGKVMMSSNALNLLAAHVNSKRSARASAKVVAKQKERVGEEKQIVQENVMVFSCVCGSKEGEAMWPVDRDI